MEQHGTDADTRGVIDKAFTTAKENHDSVYEQAQHQQKGGKIARSTKPRAAKRKRVVLIENTEVRAREFVRKTTAVVNPLLQTATGSPSARATGTSDHTRQDLDPSGHGAKAIDPMGHHTSANDGSYPERRELDAADTGRQNFDPSAPDKNAGPGGPTTRGTLAPKSKFPRDALKPSLPQRKSTR